MEFEKNVLDKLDKIEAKQVEHTVQLAINSQILLEHHKRSTNLETRMDPVEDHVKFIMGLLKLVAVAFAALSAVGGVIGLFLKK